MYVTACIIANCSMDAHERQDGPHVLHSLHPHSSTSFLLFTCTLLILSPYTCEDAMSTLRCHLCSRGQRKLALQLFVLVLVALPHVICHSLHARQTTDLCAVMILSHLPAMKSLLPRNLCISPQAFRLTSLMSCCVMRLPFRVITYLVVVYLNLVTFRCRAANNLHL